MTAKKAKPTPAPKPKKAEPIELDELADDYAQSVRKPSIGNLLIVALSTFPESGELKQSHCRISPVAASASFDYFYQQEPFLWRLKEEPLQNQGNSSKGPLVKREILMLVTPEARQIRSIRFDNGETERISPQAYFMRAAKQCFAPDDPLFKSVEVDQEAPFPGVCSVAEHLREVKNNNLRSIPLKTYLGTNGGLRGTQLILEAILSLLKADQIRIQHDGVWSIRNVGHGQYELFSGAEEFRAFDFVSGINEFMNYGRIDSLESFLKTNPDLYDEAAKELLAALKTISEGISFCSVRSFEAGLDRLAAFYQNGIRSENLYIELFRESIRRNFGKLLEPERQRLDEVRWCREKGFFQQAFTIIESGLPGEFFKKGIVSCDQAALNHAKEAYSTYDPENVLFNRTLQRFFTPGKEEKKPRNLSVDFPQDKGNGLGFNTAFDFDVKAATIRNAFFELMRLHYGIKQIRNKLNHLGEMEGDSTEKYKKDLEMYTTKVLAFYKQYEKLRYDPVLRLTGY